MFFSGNNKKMSYKVTNHILDIKITKCNDNDIDLSSIYTREYFKNFGLKIIDIKNIYKPSKEPMQPDLYDDDSSGSGSDSDTSSEYLYDPDDKTDFLPNIKSEYELQRDIKEKGLEEVIFGKKDLTISSGYNILPLNKQEKNEPLLQQKKESDIEGVIVSIKLKKGQTVIGLKDYQEKMEEYREDNMLMLSGLKYHEIENVVRDVLLSVKEYGKLGKQVEKIDRDKMLKIGDRIILLECDLVNGNIAVEGFEEIVKKEILKECGISEDDLKGTRIL